MKFTNIESLWAYAKKKMPSAIRISSIQKTGSSKFFDLTVPRSIVKKFPADASGDLEYTFNEVAGEIEYILENNGATATIVDSGDFVSAVSVYIGVNESLTEGAESFFHITHENFDNYGIQQDAYLTMTKLTGATDFWFVNRYNQQNQETVGIDQILSKTVGKTSIKSKFDNYTPIEIYKIAPQQILVLEKGQSKFDEHMYLSNELYKTLKVNEAMNESKLNLRPLSPRLLTDFTIKELDYLRQHLGSSIYQVTAWNKNFKTVDKVVKAATKKEVVTMSELTYTRYETPKGQSIILLDTGFGDIAYMLGSTNLNESTINENALIGIEDSTLKDWDKQITFEFSGTRAALEAQLQKLKYPHFLEVLPSNEAQIHVRNKDVTILKAFIQALREHLNEGELMKTTGKIFNTLSDTGLLSDDALKTAIKTLSGKMSELSTDPAEESIKAYRECEDSYQCLIDELTKRGLSLK